MTDAAKDTMFELLSKYGFPSLVAVFLAWFIRTDLLIPLLDEHRTTVKELRETQREIAKAITEQTKLLYALQPRSDRAVTVKSVESDSQPN
jgi:F420-0:gamma-glutamyl ligase-like protein